MSHRSWRSTLDVAQEKGQRHCEGRNQGPEHVYIGEERCLCLDLLTDPADRLLRRLQRGTALNDKNNGSPAAAFLIRDTRRDGLLGETALVELPPEGEHIGGERDPD
jgi:hypothetical protein